MNNKQKLEKIFDRLNNLDQRLNNIEKRKELSTAYDNLLKISEEVISCLAYFKQNKSTLTNLAIKTLREFPCLTVALPCFINLDLSAVFYYDVQTQRFISLEVNGQIYKNILEN